MKQISELKNLNYPRPQLRRKDWLNLNGKWKFVFDDRQLISGPDAVTKWTHEIEVPFAPEASRSGIGDTSYHRCCWYQREFELPKKQGPAARHTTLHFGAVDYRCDVWINDRYVGSHEGGYTSFYFDVDHALNPQGRQTITVRAEDDPSDLAKPRGKQDWKLQPHGIWYPRTTGIWQTVWLEQLPEIYIDRLRWTPHLERWEIACEAFISESHHEPGMTLRLSLTAAGQQLANDTYEVVRGEVLRRIALSDPGIDDYRNKLLWSPEKPTLIQAQLELWQDKRLLDRVESYTALRSVGVHRDRFMLNGRPYYLRLVLDQGHWPDTLMTAPSEQALRRDIELTKKMGFNGVRKHQKVEDPLYLYWADVLGLAVCGEMPSAYRFTYNSVHRLTREWMEVIDRDYNHPCIILWVPFNESWGVPDVAGKPAHQNCVQAVYHLTHTLDGTRPVIGNDGWESTATEIIGIHDYDNNPERLASRYAPDINVADILGRRRPAGRMLTVEGQPHRGQPFMLTEFGGIACMSSGSSRDAWGYDVSSDEADFERKYTALLDAVNRIELFSGFCYTQLTDTFQEVNGLLRSDRTPKFPLAKIARATLGGSFPREELIAKTVRTRKLRGGRRGQK